jgi:hypothetical protein
MPPRIKIPRIYLEATIIFLFYHVWSAGFPMLETWYVLSYMVLPARGFAIVKAQRCAMQRYLCQCPSCKRTFSVLPDDVLPYCHFYLDGLLNIIGRLATGMSCYRIAKPAGGASGIFLVPMG